MVLEKAVYRLTQILDNPLFEGFAFKERKSLLRIDSNISSDFLPHNRRTLGRKWTAPRLRSVWVPQTVVGRVRPFNDYPCINLGVPAFSKRAVDILRNFLEPNGELLPLISSVGEYFAYNVTTVADILDLHISEVDWVDEARGMAFEINRYEFITDKLEGLSIFRIVEDPAYTYVSQDFVERVKKYDLQGFCFNKVWPWPKGISWKAESKKQWEEYRKLKTPKGTKSITQNSVIIRLHFQSRKPTKENKKVIDRVLDELDDLLVTTKKELYYGNLEGNEYADGECRLFFSCPDANTLAEKLLPWIKKLKWPEKIQIVKRFGEYVDAEASEEYINI